ncbi:uncharacterized protein LOC100376072 [Saccoglossus kowalevskii]|uniref:Uncharacterized protein LOC100376072 n=1 Tax=Saccoglossus kowalevskii TaxID=10224 RepID=A0ABM0MJV1_SACKO|nr:PREDICTED: uncharacterized protein LOC100376072 [Saccoglossus kowalevskii]
MSYPLFVAEFICVLSTAIADITVTGDMCGGCTNGGHCIEFPDNNMMCQCNTKFYGKHCEYERGRNLFFDCRFDGGCMHGGECIADSGICVCYGGEYFGDKCQYHSDGTTEVSLPTTVGISIGLAAVIVILVTYTCMRYGIGQIIRDKQAARKQRLAQRPVLTTTGFPCRLHDTYESPVNDSYWSDVPRRGSITRLDVIIEHGSLQDQKVHGV